jgi:hypothetical protein
MSRYSIDIRYQLYLGVGIFCHIMRRIMRIHIDNVPWKFNI